MELGSAGERREENKSSGWLSNLKGQSRERGWAIHVGRKIGGNRPEEEILKQGAEPEKFCV